MFDGLSSLLRDEPMKCTDAELLGTGWDEIPSVDELLLEPPLDPASSDYYSRMGARFFAVSLVCLRSLSQLQQRESFAGCFRYSTARTLLTPTSFAGPTLLPLRELVSSFSKLRRIIDIQEALMQTKMRLGSQFWGPARRLGATKFAVTLEASLLQQARRHCRGRMDELWYQAGCRFLQHLKAVVLAVPCQNRTQEVAHLSAVLLVLLELVPDWTGVALDAAAAHQEGAGPLAAAGFSMADLNK